MFRNWTQRPLYEQENSAAAGSSRSGIEAPDGLKLPTHAINLADTGVPEGTLLALLDTWAGK